MIEQVSGEAGVLRTALGVVLGMDGIDARVRLYLWSGGVEDVVLPVVEARRLPQGAQVLVMFLSDRPQSGLVLGTVEGNLSWRRTAPPAFGERFGPWLLETMGSAVPREPSVTVLAGLFAMEPEEGAGQFDSCVLLADGRVFFVPALLGSSTMPLRPHIWDPVTGGVHEVAWEGETGEEYRGGVLLHDGRVFFMPSPLALYSQARIYDPSLDRVLPAGEPLASGCCGCVVVPDGRVVMVPHLAARPLLYDPQNDTVTVSQVVVPPEMAPEGISFLGGVLLPDGRVLFVPHGATAAMVYDPISDSAVVVAGPAGLLGGGAFAGGVLLADGRVYLVGYLAADGCVYDPSAGVFTVAPRGYAGRWRGGVLLGDGRVLLLPYEGTLAEACVYDPETNTHAGVAELAGLAQYGELGFAGGVALGDGRVVFCPLMARDLVVWEPGGGGLGRDVVLSGFWNKGV